MYLLERIIEMVTIGKRATKYGMTQNYRGGVLLSQPGKREKKKRIKGEYY